MIKLTDGYTLMHEHLTINLTPGDLDEMAWQKSTLKKDIEFLIRVTKEAQRERTFRKLPYEVNTSIVLPWLERFALLIGQMAEDSLCVSRSLKG